MADKRKSQLRNIEKKMKALQDKHPDVNLNDFNLKEAFKDYHELFYQHFHLKFEIEHCPECSQLLPQYKNNGTKNN